MKRLAVVLTLVIAVIVSGMALSSCGMVPPPGGTSLTISTFSDLHAVRACGPYGACPLNNSGGSPVPGMVIGMVNSCMNINSDIPGRHAMCRVVEGYDKWNYDGSHGTGALYDRRNWDIKIIAGHPKMVAVTRDHGVSIATEAYPPCEGEVGGNNGCQGNGASNMFEGCEMIGAWDGLWPLHSDSTSTDHFICEFRVFNQVITTHNSSNAWDQILSNAWPWFQHSVIGSATCAFGLMGLTAGTALGLKLLAASDCWEQTSPQRSPSKLPQVSQVPSGPPDTTVRVALQ